MSSEADNAIEADSKIENEEAPPEVTDTTKEEVTKCDTSSEARVIHDTSPEARVLRDNINETPEFKNKTDMVKRKKVICKDFNAEMSLKTLRYSHKCSGPLENKAIKPKPKVKVKPIAINNDPQQPVAQLAQMAQPKPKAPTPVSKAMPPPPPPNMQPYDNLTQAQLIQLQMRSMHQEIMRRKQEKANNICQAMFKSRSKKSR